MIFLVLFIAGIYLPATPRASKSLLFAKLDKDSLLKYVPSPRIIFIGGSNLSFSLNSQLLKDSLKVNPINTGINVGIGLIYLLDNSIDYIKSGDAVIICPEYDQFFDKYAYGERDLLHTVLDVSPESIYTLRSEQWNNIFFNLPDYSISKFDITEYIFAKEDKIYGKNSFNKFGDAYTHWNMEKQKFYPLRPIAENNKFNYDVIEELYKYQKKVLEKKAVLYLTFPCFQDSSFKNNIAQIQKIESELKKKGFLLLGTPMRYNFPDTLFFNTPYHLLKKGVDYRTHLLIEDIKNSNVIKNNR